MLDQAFNAYPDQDFVKADGMDDAIIGVDETSCRLIYSITKSIQVLVSQGMTEEEAVEFFDYNISSTYVGEQTPIWCNDKF